MRVHVLHIYNATSQLLTHPLVSHGDMLLSLCEVVGYEDVMSSFTVTIVGVAEFFQSL